MVQNRHEQSGIEPTRAEGEDTQGTQQRDEREQDDSSTGRKRKGKERMSTHQLEQWSSSKHQWMSWTAATRKSGWSSDERGGSADVEAATTCHRRACPSSARPGRSPSLRTQVGASPKKAFCTHDITHWEYEKAKYVWEIVAVTRFLWRLPQR